MTTRQRREPSPSSDGHRCQAFRRRKIHEEQSSLMHVDDPVSACVARRQRAKRRQQTPLRPSLHSPVAMMALLNRPASSSATEDDMDACSLVYISSSEDVDTIEIISSPPPTPDPSDALIVSIDEEEALVVPSPNWVLPAADCIHMWRYWFHGDSIGNRTIIDSHLITVPFRLFHIPSDRSLYNSFDAVSFAMSTILAHSSVSSASEMSAMSPAALDAILVEALPRAYPSRRPTDDMYMLFTSFPRPPPPPQPFLFPSTSIRVMWMLWLRGYDGRPPLDKLRARDLHDDASKRRWWSTKQLFAKLTDVALLMPWVSSKEMLVTGMDLPSFRLMCDEVVALFAYECGSKCTLNADSLCILAATWVTETPYGSMSLTAPSYDRPPRPACTSRPMICDDVTQADEGQLPALPVRTMWPLWHRRDVSQVPYKARTWASGSILAKTRRVMRTLTEIAVETHRVLDEEALERLSTASLYRMFDEVFPVLASRYDVAVQHLVTPDKKCANLVRYQYKTSR